jgi:pimeloyl-ACP methyl ester carboxylesterase
MAVATEQRFVEAAPGYRLWAEATGDRSAEVLLLVMGANASGLTWPDALVDRLAQRHRVIRYDHRDTGRSTRAFDEHPYPIVDLATDALAVLDAHGAERAHLVGMSLGGFLVQLLLLDAPDRALSATLLCTGALEVADAPELPGPPPELLALWEHLGEPRDREAELAFKVEHWRLLSGAARGGVFDASEFRALEERILDHAGHDGPAVAHALADPSNMERGAELASVRTPTLVIEAPLDPVYPPPHAQHLASLIPYARLVSVPRLGHALPSALVPDVAAAILTHTEGAGRDAVHPEP